MTGRETTANLISSHLVDNGKKLPFVPVSAIARSVHCFLGFSTAEPLGTTEGKVKKLKFALLIDFKLPPCPGHLPVQPLL